MSWGWFWFKGPGNLTTIPGSMNSLEYLSISTPNLDAYAKPQVAENIQ